MFDGRKRGNQVPTHRFTHMNVNARHCCNRIEADISSSSCLEQGSKAAETYKKCIDTDTKLTLRPLGDQTRGPLFSLMPSWVHFLYST